MLSGKTNFISAVQSALRQILVTLHVEDHFDQVLSEIEREPLYRKLNSSWEKLEPEIQSEKWQALLEKMVSIAYASRPYCLRCGECCRQGGPSLHIEDSELLSQGVISTKQIYTLRKGELVFHNVEGRLDTLTEALIKIKEDPQSHHCIFFKEEKNECRIYSHRPLQCRAQECWNPQVLEQLWSQKKLTREYLLKEEHELLELLQVHNDRCAPEKLDSACKQFRETGDPAVLDQVLYILSQDLVIRTFFTNRVERSEEELDFLLGRPLAVIVQSYGMKVEKDQEGIYHMTSN